MNDELDDLKRAYRDINAPPHLATRISANVTGERVRSHAWMPATATLMAVAAIIWMLPLVMQQSVVTTTPIKPSLSALASLKPAKPAVVAPSLTQLRSVSVPKMPAKPKPARSSKPQTHHRLENDFLKEKDHGYI